MTCPDEPPEPAGNLSVDDNAALNALALDTVHEVEDPAYARWILTQPGQTALVVPIKDDGLLLGVMCMACDHGDANLLAHTDLFAAGIARSMGLDVV